MTRFILHSTFVCLVCVLVISKGHATTESIYTKPISRAFLDVLKRDLRITEVLAIINGSPSRAASKEYLRSQQHLKFLATQKQDPMVLDGYTVMEPKSPIIGYSLFYYGSSGPLVIADALLNPMHVDAIRIVSNLVASSLDSVSNPDGSKMYFLGIYEFDPSRVIKIMIRKGSTPMGPDYSIRYAVLQR